MNPRSRASEASQRRERVLVLFANRANDALLRTLLNDRYTVIDSVRNLDRDDPTGPFELCICDSIALRELWLPLRAIRDQYRPLLLPVLVLADRSDVALLSQRVWEVADDVLMRPVERLELALRIQSLTRLRAMSVELSDLSQRFEHERRIAQRLQDAALPSTTLLPGLTFDALYRPGSSDANVGGDWYDALRLPDGRVVFIIGDVAGSGLEAAVTMTNVRHALRGIAFLQPDPATMLDAADRALSASEPERLVTAFVGVYDAVTSMLHYASAGHPWPFLRRAEGAVEQLRSHGTPLGFPWRMAHQTEARRLRENDVLVLYTDGLTEAHRDLLADEDRLAAAIGTSRITDRPDAATALWEEMLEDDALDDVAIAVIGIRRNDRIMRWQADSRDPESARAAERALIGELTSCGLPVAVTLAETILAELVGNVVRHAPGPFEIALDCSGEAAVLHILDGGTGFKHAPRLPADALTECGRGLFIVSALGNEFNVERRTDGGSHARVVLPSTADLINRTLFARARGFDTT